MWWKAQFFVIRIDTDLMVSRKKILLNLWWYIYIYFGDGRLGESSEGFQKKTLKP